MDGLDSRLPDHISSQNLKVLDNGMTVSACYAETWWITRATICSSEG